jgi:tetratricopeptide (TPR) repeat protein
MHSARSFSARGAVFLSIILIAATAVELATAQSPTELPVVYQLPDMDKVVVKKDIVYKTDGDAKLKVDVYYPPNLDKSAKLPLVIFNNGVGAMAIPQWRVYQDWAKLVAVNGMIAVNYQSRQGAAFKDTNDLIDYLRKNANALQIDADRIGIWTCSGNVGVGLPLSMQENREYIRCAVVYYGIAELNVIRQTLPLFVVRAGQDARGLNQAIDQFVQTALLSDLNFQFINYLEGQHAFDIVDDNDRSREIIKQTLDFLKSNLLEKKGAAPETVLTATTFYDMLMRGQSDSALAQYKRARTKFSGNPFYHWIMNERGMNTMGYQLLQDQRNEAAVEVMKINVENHPNSANVYDSLGDAYEAVGDTAQAIHYSEKALAVLQADSASNQDFQGVRESAEGKLQRLKRQ